MKKMLFGMLLLMLLAIGSVLTFIPSAATEEKEGNIFSSQYIDDAGVRMAVKSEKGQVLDETFHDKEHNIKVNFKRILTDDKETKLLLTYQSDERNLKNDYIDLWEGVSKINLIVGDEKQSLENVGWGSRYYSEKENKVYEALSFDSVKAYEGQDIRLEIQDLTIWNNGGSGSVETTWPLAFELESSATFDRETVEVNEEFTFKGETYDIKQAEFSALETRVVVRGSDVKMYTDESGMKYEKRSELEKLFMNPRKSGEEYGYRADKKKTGVFLSSAGKDLVPIYSKEEVHDDDNYVMAFAPVKDRQNLLLKVGKDIEIPLMD